VLFALLPALIAPRPQPAPQTGRPGPGADPGSGPEKGAAAARMSPASASVCSRRRQISREMIECR
jgi:hypothetical protein